MADRGGQLEASSVSKLQQNTWRKRGVRVLFLSLALFLVPFLGQRGSVVAEREDLQSLSLPSNPFGVLTDLGVGGPTATDVQGDALVSHIGFDTDDYQSEHPAEETNENGIRIYVVQSGDTLSEIAEKFGISVNTIKWENNLDSNTLRVGKELRILPVTGVLHTVRKGDTISSIAKRYDVPVDNIKLYNNVDEKKLKPGMKLIVPNGVKRESLATTKSPRRKYSKSRTTKTISSNSRYRSYFIRPSQGSVTSQFGPRRGSFHYGIDYGQYWGAPVVASANGVVEKVVSYCRVGSYRCGGGYGNNVLIRHSNGTKTRYAHLKSTLVKVGQRVKQGQKIGTMGNTGNVRPRPRSRNSHAGTHLHFEIVDSRTGRKINPNFLR